MADKTASQGGQAPEEFPLVEFPLVELEPPTVAAGLDAPGADADTSRAIEVPGVQPSLEPVVAQPPRGQALHVRYRWTLLLGGIAALVLVAVVVVLLTRSGDSNPDQAQTVLAPAAAQVKQVLQSGAQATTVAEVARTGQQATSALDAITQADTQVATIKSSSAQTAAGQALQGERALLQGLAALKDTRPTKQSLSLWSDMIRNQVVTAQAQLGAAAATLQALNLSQPGLAIVTPGDIDPTVTNINRLMSTNQQRLAKQSHARRGVLATVHRTCGSNGLGDCYLSLRRAPNSASPEVHRINEGDKIRVVCQVTGENAHSTALGGWTTVWSRDARGRYMSNAYLEAPRLDPYRLTLPTCR